MKKQRTWRGKHKASTPTVVMDEFYCYAGNIPIPAASKYEARRVVATQAIMKFNSGKRVRFICSAHWEDTGEPVKSAPPKFLPAQVLRRQAGN